MSEMPTLDHLFHAVMEQREEILRAFVAKYGIGPEEVVQVQQDGHWFLMKRDHILQPVILPDMVREAEAHLPYSVVAPPARWQWFADYYNRAIRAPNEPCPCCNTTPAGDVLDHLPMRPLWRRE